MTDTHHMALRVSAVLRVIRGFVHALAAFLVAPADLQTETGNVLDRVDSIRLAADM